MQDVNGVVRSQGNDVRELAWTMTGASAGNLARHRLDPLWPGSEGSPWATAILAAVAAGMIGFALVAGIRISTNTVLIAIGGAAGSVSAMATRAATATPAQSLPALAAFFVGAVIGVLLGMFSALRAANPRRAKGC
jgi:fluoride ion exporter CrcB/FEX